MSHSTNLILRSLPDRERQKLAPLLRNTVLHSHDVLYENHTAIERYESAMVGRDGVVGASAALDGRVSLSKAVVQVEGVGCQRYRASPASTP